MNYTDNLELALTSYYELLKEARNILKELIDLDRMKQSEEFNEIIWKADKFIDKTEDAIIKEN